MFLLGALYQTGTFIEIDRDKALKWLLLASHKGITDAQVMTANNYALRFSRSVDENQKQSFFKKAGFWYANAISRGSVIAKRQYGQMLLHVDMVSKEGLSLLHQAADLGDARAMHSLGLNSEYLWRESKKTEYYDSARFWYQKSIDAGFHKSELYLKKLRQ
jgi:TPR repeat protein